MLERVCGILRIAPVTEYLFLKSPTSDVRGTYLAYYCQFDDGNIKSYLGRVLFYQNLNQLGNFSMIIFFISILNFFYYY